MQNTTLNLTLTHALAMTPTLTPDPNSKPNPIAIPHLYSAFSNSAFYRTPSIATRNFMGTARIRVLMMSVTNAINALHTSHHIHSKVNSRDILYIEGVKTLRTQDTSDPRHFGTSAEVSIRHMSKWLPKCLTSAPAELSGHFGTSAKLSWDTSALS